MKNQSCFSTRCDGVTRRDMLRVGGLTALGLGLGSFFNIQRTIASTGLSLNSSPKAKSCILIWLDGGASHLETFDPKPDAPSEIRGPLETIPTTIPGIRFSECMVQTAKMTDKLAVIRSMTSPLGEHVLGTQYMMTGYKPTPVLEYPSFGATLAYVRKQHGVLPPNISIQNSRNSENGYLPSSTSPFLVGGEDRNGNRGNESFMVRDLDFYQGLDLTRLNRRREFVNALDNFSRAKDTSTDHIPNPDLERAYNLISSTEAKKAFDLANEPEAVRNRYGLGNNIGQSCLLARRLVERGVPFVTVNSSGWDTHQNLYRELKERYTGDQNAKLPALDRALSALLQDLSDRNMLNETLVVVMGEFGRTPKVNALGGRDHWPNVFSVALAGGGVQGGQVIGSSDSLGEYPKDNPITPSDLSTTLYTLLGIDPSTELYTGDGRPVRVAPDDARVITELLA